MSIPAGPIPSRIRSPQSNRGLEKNGRMPASSHYHGRPAGEDRVGEELSGTLSKRLGEYEEALVKGARKPVPSAKGLASTRRHWSRGQGNRCPQQKAWRVRGGIGQGGKETGAHNPWLRAPPYNSTRSPEASILLPPSVPGEAKQAF